MHIIGVILFGRFVFWLLMGAVGAKGSSTATLTQSLLRLMVLGTATYLWLSEDLWLPALILFVCWVIPTAFARYVLVPVGIPYLNIIFLRFVHFGMGQQVGVFYEIWARSRSGWGLSAPSLIMLEREVRASMAFPYEHDGSVRGAAIAALGLLEAHQGNDESARALLRFAMELSWKESSLGTRVYSQGWLLADAWARDDYREVMRLSRRGPVTAQRFFFRSLVQRKLGTGGRMTDFVCRICPYFCANPLAARRLERAVRTSRPLALPERIAGDFAHVQRVTLEALRGKPWQLRRAQVIDLALAWEVTLESGELRDEACSMIGASHLDHTIELAMRSFVSQLEERFVQWCKACTDLDEPIEIRANLVRRAIELIEQDLVERIEVIAEALPLNKSSADREMTTRWRDWATLCSSLEELERLDPTRAEVVTEDVRLPITNHAVWLFNEHHAHFLAGKLFEWLLHRTPRSHEDRKLLAKNLRLAQG